MNITIDQIIYTIIYAVFTTILTGILAPITLRKYDEWKKECERIKKEEEKQKEEYLENLMDIEREIKKLIEIVKKDDYKNRNINDYISDSLIKIFSDNLIETLTELKNDFIELSEWYEVCGYIIYKETKNVFEQITPKFYKNSKHHITVFSNKFYKYYLNGIKVTKQLLEEKEIKFYEDSLIKALEISDEINELQLLINGLNEAFIMNSEVFRMNKYLIKYRDKKRAFIQMGEDIIFEISEILNPNNNARASGDAPPETIK